ncbi:hypothetical protein GUITHDRAFT_82805, partial [Guillardia theta CCMP2712]
MKTNQSQRQVTVVKLHPLCCVEQVSLLMQISRHPRLVEVLGTSFNQNSNYLVNEFCSGKTLQESIKTKALSLTHMRVILLQIVAGMEALHGGGLVHGNLSLENILCLRLEQEDISSTSIKLSDFGLLMRHPAQESSVSSLLPPSPDPPSVSYRRRSPESIRTSTFTAESDVWAFGVVTWQILSDGIEPYSHCSKEDQVKHAILSGVRLSKPSRCPADLWELILSCCQQVAASRP